MEIRLLRYFLAVVESGTVTEAAAELQMTQPALSRQITVLEKRLGLRLFQRAGARNVPTREGKEFVAAARRVLHAEADARQLAQILASGQLSSVSLAAPRTTLIDVVAPFIATFSDADPSPEVSEITIDADPARTLSEHDLLITTHSGAVSMRERSRPALPGTQRPPEAAVVREGEGSSSIRLARLPVWAYVPEEHHLAGHGEVSVAELAEEALVLPSQDFRARQVIAGALDVCGLWPKRVVEVYHGRVAQALSRAGRGVAVVSDDAYFGLVPLTITIPDEPLEVELHAVWRADHYARERLEELAVRLRAFCSARYGSTLE